MSGQNYFVLTAAQRTASIAFNDIEDGVAIAPIAVSSATPGSGLNLNEQADGYDAGDPVTLADMWVAPYRIVNDPDYLQFVPDMIAYLLTLPMANLENETIFLPAVEE